MAALRNAKDQYAKVRSNLADIEDTLHSLRWGGADIPTLRKSQADLQQVQPAHELAFNKLVDLLDDDAEYDAAHTDFCADGSSADKLSQKI